MLLRTEQPRGLRRNNARSEYTSARRQGALPLHSGGGPDCIFPGSPLGRALTLSCSLGECWSCAFEPRFPPTTIKLGRPPTPLLHFLASSSERTGRPGTRPRRAVNELFIWPSLSPPTRLGEARDHDRDGPLSFPPYPPLRPPGATRQTRGRPGPGPLAPLWLWAARRRLNGVRSCHG
ncbi:hypothetical protein AAFF_G00053980 [Aldrovandia affinis]|uniref:Uncharacterized protein n=1 Tax=Aldrovandia affinis TaxID=143900 RepID=A0AAD7S149_9TELE|nr:hypothetical protein AAFF_G00053980 [Aldrovandia affinis]